MPNLEPDHPLRSALEEMEASIYFRVQRDGAYDWYVIKSDSRTPECKILYPIFDPPPKYQRFSGCAALGSTIYVFGGADTRHGILWPPMYDDVYYIDTLRPKEGWKKGYSMKKSRMSPYAFTVNGKIYVMGSHFGGGGNRRMRPWPGAEVFDPQLEDEGSSWHALRDVTHMPLPHVITGHAILDDGMEILVHAYGSESLYSYDVEADSWKVYVENFGCFKNTSACVDGILYYFDFAQQQILYGLDISHPENLAKPVKVEGGKQWLPQPDFENTYPTTFLVSLGNSKLAVVWSLRCCSLYTESVLYVHCSKLKMSKKKLKGGEFGFVAKPKSLSQHHANGSLFVNCLAVFPSQKREAQEDVNKDDNSHDKTSPRTSTSSNYNNGHHNKNKNKNKKKKRKNKNNK